MITAWRTRRRSHWAGLPGGRIPRAPDSAGGIQFWFLGRPASWLRNSRVTDLVGLGVPVDKTDITFLRACTKPKLLVQGANDQFGSRGNLERLFHSNAGAQRTGVRR